MMPYVTFKDGTRIAYDKSGNGPAARLLPRGSVRTGRRTVCERPRRPDRIGEAYFVHTGIGLR